MCVPPTLNINRDIQTHSPSQSTILHCMHVHIHVHIHVGKCYCGLCIVMELGRACMHVLHTRISKESWANKCTLRHTHSSPFVHVQLSTISGTRTFWRPKKGRGVYVNMQLTVLMQNNTVTLRLSGFGQFWAKLFRDVK